MTELDLINRVQTKQDSAALTELINRHSGMYVKMVQRFACVERNSGFGSAKLDTHDMMDDKDYNIWQFVLSYDPTRNMKLSTFIGERTRYTCLDILNSKKVLADHTNKVEVTEDTPLTAPASASTPADNTLAAIRARSKNVTDERFWSIFNLRHFVNGGGYTWRTIGERLGITHEGARQIYQRNIKHLKYHLIK